MKRKVFFKLIGFIICALCLTVLPAVGLAAEITLKLGHVAPTGTTHDICAKKFAERVAANTGGRVVVKVFGNSQFGTLPEHWGQLKSGAIDLFDQDLGAGFMVEPPPKNFIISIFPYVFETQEHFHRFLRSDLFKSMMGKVEKAANVKYIGYLGDRTPRGFSTTDRKVMTPDDIKGLKLRVPPVPPFVAAYKAWGAAPTPVHAKDLYTSVKSGMVVGIDQDLVNVLNAKYYEIQKYYVCIDYMRSGLGCWINADKWNALPEDLKALFLKSAQETEEYVNPFTAEQMSEAEEKLAEKGMEILHPDLKPWMELAEKEVLKNEGKMWDKGLYHKIKALK
jgi:TRAP-type C4-dicarboxylate transport system substrate-binding protein